MRAVVQRVSEASVTVEAEIVGQIGRGLLVLVGVAEGDTDSDATSLATKIAELRLFPEESEDSGMERSLTEIGGAILVVSQFTLMGDCRKGRRPSWLAAARPDEGKRLYELFVETLRARGIITETGTFRTHMTVKLINDGPVTILLDSRKAF
ncbi:D-aminoacyl-tRNA deacylase [Armatimonas sp.]|uniref:D-aminoacyl-tRNA deacylase n=1 Tax=Armatimonas sp. TaxID=1872638 RepID=UPI00286A3A1A|nr:D-aminoacyl-tRNA deacylase [Armatimonas sp.]